jgi:hypothetical protein
MTCVAGADDMDDLEALFEEDPAQGFVVAAKMFKRPLKAGDLDWMLEIIELTADWSRRCAYFAALEDMVEAAVPIA